MQMTGILVKQFSLTAFRDWQLEIIQAVLAKKEHVWDSGEAVGLD